MEIRGVVSAGGGGPQRSNTSHAQNMQSVNKVHGLIQTKAAPEKRKVQPDSAAPER